MKSMNVPEIHAVFAGQNANIAPVAIEIRTAQSGDADAACNVLRRSIATCCTEDHRNDEKILSAWLGNKIPETIAAWFAAPANFSLVALVGNALVGVALLTRAGKISLCHVDPEVRFTGAGKALLQAMESEARQWGVRELRVCSTETARAFYLRNGFIECGPGKSAYGAETITLAKSLCGNASPNKSPCSCN